MNPRKRKNGCVCVCVYSRTDVGVYAECSTRTCFLCVVALACIIFMGGSHCDRTFDVGCTVSKEMFLVLGGHVIFYRKNI